MTALFDFVKPAIRQRGWSIPTFARECRVSVQLAYKWLAEDASLRITPSPASCAKIAEALNVDVDYILELAGHRKPQSAKAEVSARRQAERDQLDQWMSAVGPDYEGFFWDDLKNRADSTVRLIQQIRTAVNPDPGTAINQPSNDRSKRGRRRRGPSDGRLTGTKYAAAGYPAARYRPPLERKAA